MSLFGITVSLYGLNIIITYICDKHHEQRPQQIYILKLRFILIVVSRNEMKRKQSGTPFNKKKQKKLEQSNKSLNNDLNIPNCCKFTA